MRHQPDEPRMGTFLLISVIVHLALLLFGPQAANRAVAQFPSLLSGGVVQVVRLDEPVAARRTTPQRVQPERKPAPAPSRPEPEPPAAPEPEPEPARQVEPEPEPDATIQAPAPERPAEPALTSPQGKEPVPDLTAPPRDADPEPEPSPKPAAQEPPAERVDVPDEGAASSKAPASEPVPEEPGPPQLPPLGEPGSLVNLGSTGLGYPKNAENEGLEGDVVIRLEMDAQGNVQQVILIQPSGHKTLDDYAMRGLRHHVQSRTIRATTQAAPYAVLVRVSFRREEGAFMGHMELVGTAEYLQER